jgi:creatinine amidohydrolase
MIRRAVELLKESHEDWSFVRLPPLYVAADVVPQTGSVAFRTSTLISVLSDLGRSLAKQGFKHIWVSNFHGGPRHFTSIEVACHRTNKRYGTRMVSVFGLMLNRLTGGNTDLSDILGGLDGLRPEDLEGDTHGGLVETSLMLHLLGEHVDPGYKDLAKMTVAIKESQTGRSGGQLEGRPSLFQLLRSFRSKLKYYEEESYSGSPAIATPELGQQILDVLAGLASDALADLLAGKISVRDCHSPLWRVRWLFTFRPVSWMFERLVGHQSQVW